LGLSEVNITKRSKLIVHKANFIAYAAIHMYQNFYCTLRFLSSFYLFIFFTCIKKTNQKKMQPFTCPPEADALCCSNLPGAYKLGFASNSISSFFGRFCATRLREMAFTTEKNQPLIISLSKTYSKTNPSSSSFLGIHFPVQ